VPGTGKKEVLRKFPGHEDDGLLLVGACPEMSTIPGF